MKVTDLASVVAPDTEQRVIGIRPGEKLHEQMIGAEDAVSTYEYEGYFKILPVINDWANDANRIKNGQKVAEDFYYESSTNSEWMTNEELTVWLKENEKMSK